MEERGVGERGREVVVRRDSLMIKEGRVDVKVRAMMEGVTL